MTDAKSRAPPDNETPPAANWDGGELPVWPLHRTPDPATFVPMLGGDPRLYTDRWQEVKQEQDKAAAEREAREEKERKAEALKNYRGPW